MNTISIGKTGLGYAGLVLIIFSSCSSKQQNPDCSKLKKGRFEYHGGYGDRVFSIERNDSIQIEKDLLTGYGAKLSIKWTGPCEYELSPLSFSVNGRDTLPDTAPSVVKTIIKKITKNYYICESTDGKGGRRVDSIVIIK